MRQGILLFCCAALATLASAGTASATLVYEKGGAVYSASNSGKGSKLIAPNGRQPAVTPNGQTVVYTDPSKAIFTIPVAGGTPLRLAATDCSRCWGQFAPDGSTLSFVDPNRNLDLVPLGGGPAVRLATELGTSATFSPDSKFLVFDKGSIGSTKLFTVPAAGGTPTQLALKMGMYPVWTGAGIVATTIVKVKLKPQFQTVLLDAGGKVKRVLTRKTIKSEKAFMSGRGIAIAFQAVGSNFVSVEIGKRKTAYLRLVSASNGKVKAKRKLKNYDVLENMTPDGKTLLTITKGKLEAVNFKTGKRKTLIAKGVKHAYMN